MADSDTAPTLEVPHGYTAIAPNVFVNDTSIIVTGTPHPTEDETDPRYHNCDVMGCGREHVIYTARLLFTVTPPKEPAT